MHLSSRFVITLAVACELLGMVIFLKGFFPIKQGLPGRAEPADIPAEPGLQQHDSSHHLPALQPVYGRMILVLIDALRADFVLKIPGSSLPRMQFVGEKIDDGEAISFVAKSHAPTVTMPRIKALTTGGIPGFVDVVLNFDSKALSEDNLVSQLRNAGKKIVFYGDDTWMKLFPDHFERTDGTTSFFVTDYTEVDNNVTRHINEELLRSDWEVMILHYLGLDHIGHLAGPRSPLVDPKLREMDAIIKQLYTAILEQDKERSLPTLLVLCGDHGMSDQGSHGGSSVSETLTPLVMLRSAFTHRTRKYDNMRETIQVDQIDLVPTLAVLLGVPIPKNSLGTMVTPALRGMSPRQQLMNLNYNTHQLLEILKQNVQDYTKEKGYLQFERALQLHAAWLQHFLNQNNSGLNTEQLAENVAVLYKTAMAETRDRLAASLLNYDMQAMLTGIWLLWSTLLMLVFYYPASTVRESTSPSILMAFIIAIAIVTGINISCCTSRHRSELLCFTDSWWVIIPVAAAVLSCLTVAVTVIHISIARIYQLYDWVRSLSLLPLWFFTGAVVHTFSLLSSSFVEEEHQTWYFYIQTTCLLLVYLHLQQLFSGSLNLQKSRQCSDDRSHDQGHVTYPPSAANQNDTAEYEYSYEEISTNQVFSNSPHINDGLWDRSKTKSNVKFMEHDEKENITSSDMVKSRTKLEESRVLRQSENVWCIILCLCVAAICRVMRRWNQTGDKWINLPDVGDWLVRPENIPALSFLCVAGLLTVNITRGSCHSLTASVCMAVASVAVYCTRSASGAVILPGFYEQVSKGVREARIVYAIFFLMLVRLMAKWYKKKKKHESITTDVSSVHDKKSQNELVQHTDIMTSQKDRDTSMQDMISMWLILMLLLMRPHNIALVAMAAVTERCISYVTRKTRLSLWMITLLYIWMGQAHFHFQGNSNNISTVDVSAGYIGLEDYQPVIIGLLMSLSTYAGPIYWQLALLAEVVYLSSDDLRAHCFKKVRLSLRSVAHVICLSRSLPLAVYTVLVTLQRYHLFVWTVFSPKLLYEGCTTVVLSVVVIIQTYAV